MGAKVPVVPGSEGAVRDEHEAIKVAQEIGYPVMIKASSGGGRRGMRVREQRAQPQERTAGGFGPRPRRPSGTTRSTSRSSSSDRATWRCRSSAIGAGNIIHLGERDCSIQRRHQKLIEESPSSSLTSKQRDKLGIAAIRMAKAAGYHNAGTVEFLLSPDGNFYFIEVNARIQVEHSVTELVTGVDLIQEQIRIAAGENLRFRQKDIQNRGHAIECRINAEDPARDFRPSPGRLEAFIPPGGPGVRVDTHCYSG